MEKTIKIHSYVLNNLSDEELKLLISYIPLSVLSSEIQKRSKDFKADTKGSRLELKSPMYANKLPTIFFEHFKKGDRNIRKRIYSFAELMINKINQRLLSEPSKDDYFSNIINNDDLIEFSKFVEIVLYELKPEYIKLFFRLIGYELTIVQNDYLDNDLKVVLEKKNLIEKIQKENEADFEKRVLELEIKHKANTSSLNDRIKDLETQIKFKNQEIMKEQNNSKDMMDKLCAHQKATDTRVILFENTIIQLNEKIQNLTKEVTKKIEIISEQNMIIKTLNDKLRLRGEESFTIVNEQYEVEIDILVNKKRNLEHSCTILKQEEEALKSNIDKLSGNVEFWDNVIKEYIENIDKKIIENALQVSLLECCKKEDKQEIVPLESKSILYVKENIYHQNIVDSDFGKAT